MDRNVDDPRIAHKIAWRVIHAGETVPKRDFLFLAERKKMIFLLHRSPRSSQVMDADEIYEAPMEDETVPFFLRANPTICVDGARIGLPTHAWLMTAKRNPGDKAAAIKAVAGALSNWLARKGEQAGFEPAVTRYRIRKKRVPVKKSGIFALDMVDFQGSLRVTSKEKLEQAVMKGIGRAKAYGCGLLLFNPHHH
jgi:CRISPR system Cascade subunit CasE